MGDKQKLQAEIDQINAEIAERQDLLNRRQEQLDALPKERVRLRAEGTHILAGDDPTGYARAIAIIYPPDLARHGIDEGKFLAHICRFGEPDVTREMEALEAASRNVVDAVQPVFRGSVEWRLKDASRTRRRAEGSHGMSDKQISIHHDTEFGSERTVFVNFWNEVIRAFFDNTPDAAMAKARTWARDLRDALNAADLDAGVARGENREDGS